MELRGSITETELADATATLAYLATNGVRALPVDTSWHGAARAAIDQAVRAARFARSIGARYPGVAVEVVALCGPHGPDGIRIRLGAAGTSLGEGHTLPDLAGWPGLAAGVPAVIAYADVGKPRMVTALEAQPWCLGRRPGPDGTTRLVFDVAAMAARVGVRGSTPQPPPAWDPVIYPLPPTLDPAAARVTTLLVFGASDADHARFDAWFISRGLPRGRSPGFQEWVGSAPGLPVDEAVAYLRQLAWGPDTYQIQLLALGPADEAFRSYWIWPEPRGEGAESPAAAGRPVPAWRLAALRTYVHEALPPGEREAPVAFDLERFDAEAAAYLRERGFSVAGPGR